MAQSFNLSNQTKEYHKMLEVFLGLSVFILFIGMYIRGTFIAHRKGHKAMAVLYQITLKSNGIEEKDLVAPHNLYELAKEVLKDPSKLEEIKPNDGTVTKGSTMGFDLPTKNSKET